MTTSPVETKRPAVISNTALAIYAVVIVLVIVAITRAATGADHNGFSEQCDDAYSSYTAFQQSHDFPDGLPLPTERQYCQDMNLPLR